MEIAAFGQRLAYLAAQHFQVLQFRFGETCITAGLHVQGAADLAAQKFTQ